MASARTAGRTWQAPTAPPAGTSDGRSLAARRFARRMCFVVALIAAGRSARADSPAESAAATKPATPAASQPSPRPNFVFFLTDDQRYDAMSVAGNRVLSTPNLDRLAAGGVRFRNAFVTTSLCAPSRATIMTGQWAHTHGVRINISAQGRQGLDPSQRTVADELRDAGYEVAFIGKWHMRNSGRDRKWDYYFGFQGQGTYFNPRVAEDDGPDRVYKDWYNTDLLAEKAIEYLHRPRSKPFCLFVFLKAPHRSWERAPRHAHLYEGVKIPEPDTIHTDYAGKPNAFRNADMKIGDHPDVPSLDVFLKNYYATLVAVDENVGRVLGALDQLRITDDTVVIYSSDNGFFAGEWNYFDKRFMHEPSIRVPLLVRYPRRVRAGQVRDEMVLNADFAPTMLELAGVAVPDRMQGRSMAPLLEERPVTWRDAWLYEYYEYPAEHSARKHRGVRTAKWKYIHYFEEPQEYELYDLDADPDEKTNLYGRAEYEPIVRMLRQRLDELRVETHDPDLKRP